MIYEYILSLLKPIVAHIVVEELIEESSPDLDFQVPILKKFKNDLFCIIPKVKINQLLTTFNNYFGDINLFVKLSEIFHYLSRYSLKIW